MSRFDSAYDADRAEADKWERLDRAYDDAADAPLDPPGYAARVRELEREGLTTSDAQGVADMEFRLMAKGQV